MPGTQATKRKKDQRSKSVYTDPPRRHVVLLSCMDTRLLDNTVQFMDSLNLQNRYDHLIFAGSAMGTRLLTSSASQPGVALPWKNVFFDHLVAAIEDLNRDVSDIFLLEHLDCGAYKKLHPDATIRKKYNEQKDIANLVPYHRHEVREFATEIEAFCQKRQQQSANPSRWQDISVHCLLMNLRGDVQEL
jgi:carbonic anhydrase